MVSTAPDQPAKVFVSYRHLDDDWVWDRLVPCLRAGGAEMLIDADHFRPGGVCRPMDVARDHADNHPLVPRRWVKVALIAPDDRRGADPLRAELTRNVV